MSVTSKRRDTEVFSMAFLDCICCGFGAMLLVFVLTVAQKKQIVKVDLEETQKQYEAMQMRVIANREDMERLARLLAAAQIELDDVTAKNNQDQLRLSDRQRELLLMLEKSGMMKEALASLLGQKQALPTEAPPTIPIPEVDRTQYLTGIQFQGEYVVFVLRASGSMLDETVDAAAARLGDTDAQKREAPKWQRVIRSVKWMIATLEPETNFQIIVFNDEAGPLIPARGDQWFKKGDRTVIPEVLDALDRLVPKGRANMEKAFEAVRYLSHAADDIVLFTDGLPTQSDSMPLDGEATEAQRNRMFDFAVRRLPPRIPVSTILFPMSGDPLGPAKFWRLAHDTHGAVVSPSKDWPES